MKENSLLDSLTDEQIESEVAYVKLTIEKGIRYKQKVNNNMANFTSDELKRHIRDPQINLRNVGQDGFVSLADLIKEYLMLVQFQKQNKFFELQVNTNFLWDWVV